VIFIVHDLIPLQHPEYFLGVDAWFSNENFVSHFERWFEYVSVCATALICNSKATTDAVCYQLKARSSASSLVVSNFYLGYDPDVAVQSGEQPPNAAVVLSHLLARPTFLMVGTIEPRKGHALALRAFDLLWAEKREVNLLIIGQAGWNTQGIAELIRRHAFNGSRLFWCEGAGDEFLRNAYRQSKCLLALSEAEGFGLPLLESAYHRLPIVCRDIPVFREVCGKHGASFFRGTEPHELRDYLLQWLLSSEAYGRPCSSSIRLISWEESAKEFMQAAGLGGAEMSDWLDRRTGM
jgi:glycosyltransferase involved in cell wall biosynthesis